MKDELGDRQKTYEEVESGRRFLPLIPVVARIDGRCFSKFTEGLNRPYDERLHNLMSIVTHYLVFQTKANIGYTQSDEISLIWYSSDRKSQIFFDGRVQKMTSQLAALTTVYFFDQLQEYFKDPLADFLRSKYPTFDARVWNVPTLSEAVNYLIWREWDATKNSISMAARHYFSHNQLHNKNSKEMQEMLWQGHNVNWNDYPTWFKRGTYIQKRVKNTPLTKEELENLPPLHEARKNPDLVIERHEIVEMNLPRLASILNRVEVIFGDQEPIME